MKVLKILPWRIDQISKNSLPSRSSIGVVRMGGKEEKRWKMEQDGRTRKSSTTARSLVAHKNSSGCTKFRSAYMMSE
ncbi:hypothetical protein P8C59_009190 [Phyllachora maydis]|uniref:Uncharacterized protein n=1 Tax=Phyllachora maydis TaxID=1825666 RepID=A0AAD9MKY6_9PEZI|nr:hypothetical protein P8C59_009190 [Phyllachora maydis]